MFVYKTRLRALLLACTARSGAHGQVGGRAVFAGLTTDFQG
jgi:hypothetical protein